MRKTNLEEGLRWLEQAEEDLRWTRHLAEQGAYHLACFLAQQVTEKALKAFLYSRGMEIVVGHSITRLCSEAAEFDKDFGHRAQKWSVLDAHYIPTRYPNGLPDSIPARVYTADAASEAVRLAAEAVALVRGKLKPEPPVEEKTPSPGHDRDKDAPNPEEVTLRSRRANLKTRCRRERRK